MNDPLATYLHDHLAGSHFATELLESLSEQYRNTELGWFAGDILAEVKQDQATLQGLIERVGAARLDLAEATGWLAEKASKFKLSRDKTGGLGTFEALEFLTLGILGKLSLWRVLPVIGDARLGETDFDKLAERAWDQYNRMETQRLQFARIAFEP